MGPLRLAWISTITILLASVSPATVMCSSMNHFNIPAVLYWIHQLSKNYHQFKSTCEKEVETIVNELDLKEYHDIEKDISEYVVKINNFRSIVLSGDVKRSMVRFELENAFNYIMMSVSALNYFLKDLRSNIEIWMNPVNGDSAVTSVRENEPFTWLRKHGFGYKTLKDVNIQEIKVFLDNMYTDGKFFGRLLEFSASRFFLNPSNDTGAMLSWLYTFTKSAEVINMFEAFLKSDSSDIPPAVAADLTESLRKLGSEDSTLHKLIGEEIDGNWSTKYTKLYEHAVIMERHLPRCLKILTIISGKVIPAITKLEEDLRSSKGYDLVKPLMENGFVAEAEMDDGQIIADRAKAFINEDGPIKMLCKATTSPTQSKSIASTLRSESGYTASHLPLGIFSIAYVICLM